MKAILILFIMAFTTAAMASAPAFICTGDLSLNDGSRKVAINKNVIFNSSYTSETLADIVNAYDVVIMATSNGGSKVFMRRSNQGHTELLWSEKVAADQNRISIVFRDTSVELDLRCAKI